MTSDEILDTYKAGEFRSRIYIWPSDGNDRFYDTEVLHIRTYNYPGPGYPGNFLEVSYWSRRKKIWIIDRYDGITGVKTTSEYHYPPGVPPSSV